MIIYNKRWSTKKLTQPEVISKFIDVHGTMYDYSLVEYKTMRVPINIICREHGVFSQTPDNHKSGKGCPICAQMSRNKNKSYTLDKILSKFKEVHGDRYDYSMVNYSGLQHNVTIICKEHGPFQKTPNLHLGLHHGCPKCPNEKVYKYHTVSLKEWISRFVQTHGDRYDYSLVNTTDSKVKIICPIHGEFRQSAKSHWRGHHCAKCSGSSISKISTKWLDSLNIEVREFQISKERQFLVDGYDPKTNTVYEFYGDYWHGNPAIYKPDDFNERNKTSFGELYNNTIEREAFIRNLGFNLVVMWENDFKSFLVHTKSDESGETE